ncbi:helix-turn-helix transcriptional regulator [Corynebacterium sp. H127]|uniref:helix-turn-helix domain-containing protein n=1 Tax=Corynebacterium sp. H127 TaxID=3133418 RepID=UPI00309CA5CA
MSPEKKATIEDFGYAVARQLTARRAHQGLTQTQLADATGISQSQLSKQLRGLRAINMDELALICHALHIDMLEIIRLAEAEIAASQASNVLPFSQRPDTSSGNSESDIEFAAEARRKRYVALHAEAEPEMGDDDYGSGA